jgi:hypothetical protein
MRKLLLGTILTLAALEPRIQAEVLPPVSQRFAVEGSKEVPSFQRHVLPLLGRLGCNGRACHGSFQGQGGFRLSLFGYDFKADHDALLKGDNPRVDLKDPARSKFVQKPARQIPHKGGKLIQVGSWQHRVLLRWIQSGAPEVKDDDPDFASLVVEPREIVFDKAGQTRQLKLVAHWADGSQEDVTPICRFRSNDESVAVVDEAGVITSVGKGGTDIVAFYDNGVVPVQVILPVTDQVGPRFPKVATPTKIDELVVGRLSKLGIVPSDLCTDVEFLRRVSLDMTGTLPKPAEVRAFLDDKSADKRTRKIDELLARPAYAAWWATRLSEWTGNTESTGPLGGERGLNGEKSKQWYQWIYRRVAENVPYDTLVEGIVLATSRAPEQSYEDYCAEMSSYFRTTNPADFSSRPNMPHFWVRKTVGSADSKALSFSHAFLGLSLQCAQCHKHPYDQWTKQDFDQFAAFFYGVSAREGPRDKVNEMKKAVELVGDSDSGAYARQFVKLAEKGKLLPFKEIAVPAPSKKARPVVRPGAKGGRVITPKLLGGDEVVANNYPDPRQPVMDWMRESDNPYFARAFVNRVWGSYFNVGLIDPPDDLNLANPPSNPALLDYLCRGFVQNNFDMKWLHREIATSRTYQLSWHPNETNKYDERDYSHAIVRRLPAEVLYDALVHATASDDALDPLHKDPASMRAIGYSSGLSNRRGEGYAVNLFGRPARVINCDCERSNEPSLLQTVYLRNDQEITKMLDRADGWLKQVSKSKSSNAEDLVQQAYLRTLNRLPQPSEAEVALRYVRESQDTISGLRDVMWALLNTKEFMVNR